MIIAQKTDMGVDKLVNEDSLLTCSWSFPCETGVERYDLLMVADGVSQGGAGEVASAETLAVIAETLARSLVACYRHPRPAVRGPDVAWLLRGAVEFANTRLIRIKEANPSFAGMATTLVAALAHGERLHVAHAGDCRLYRLREGWLEQLTRDHSLVQWMVDTGEIQPQQAFRHPHDNVVLSVVGKEKSLFVETHTHDLRRGDLLLLASDGAVSDVPVPDLLRLLGALPAAPGAAELQRFCDELLAAAMDPAVGATFDNLSAVAAYVDRIVPCVEPHACHVLRYGAELPVDRQVRRVVGDTLLYGVDAPGFRLHRAARPRYRLSSRA